MLISDKNALEQSVILAAREYVISTTLFRNAVGTKLGINPTDMKCLEFLLYKNSAAPSELSHYIGLSSGATTAMLDRLEKAGFITRRPNPTDRRSMLVAINAHSMASLEPYFADLRAAQNALVTSYSGQELEAVADFLQRLTKIGEDSRKRLQSAPESSK